MGGLSGQIIAAPVGADSPSGHVHVYRASKGNFLMRCVRRGSLPEERGIRGITASSTCGLLYSVEPPDRPMGSKMIPIPSFCHRRSRVCGINSVVGQNGALFLKLERCRGVAGDPSEACLFDWLARPWGAFPGRAPLSYPRIRISRSAHGADSDAAPGHGREGRGGRGLTPAGGFQGPSLSRRHPSVSLCWFKQTLWSSCPGEGVILTQGLMRAFRELVRPLEWAGGWRVPASEVSVLSLCPAQSLDVTSRGRVT